MVEDPAIKEVQWTSSGQTFVVTSPIEFSKCLHNYFKHNNWQSFVRQLNMYQFHKVNDVFHANAVGGGSNDSSAWEFKHPCFQRGQVDLLASIKRKASRPAPQSRETSYVYQSQLVNDQIRLPPGHGPYEYPGQSRPPHISEVQRAEERFDSVDQRISGIEESQRLLMDQSSNVFNALRAYHGILNGLANVLAAVVPDQNTAAIQADLQTLQQQMLHEHAHEHAAVAAVLLLWAVQHGYIAQPLSQQLFQLHRCRSRFSVVRV